MDEKGVTQIMTLPTEAEPRADAEEAPSRFLIVLQGATPGTMLPLGDNPLSIGRSDGCGLMLAEPSVSRSHAEVWADQRGDAWVIDCGSTNGTFLNGRQVERGEPTPIGDGDRLRIGTKVVLKFTCPDPEEEEFQRSMFERTVRDPLTGLYNRAYFLDQIGRLSARARQRDLGLAVVMLDIDRFKHINDTLGHPGGDKILRQVAALIREGDASRGPGREVRRRRVRDRDPDRLGGRRAGPCRANPVRPGATEDRLRGEPDQGDGQPRGRLLAERHPAAAGRDDRLGRPSAVPRQGGGTKPSRESQGRAARHATDGGDRRPMRALRQGGSCSKSPPTNDTGRRFGPCGEWSWPCRHETCSLGASGCRTPCVEARCFRELSR